MKIRDLTEGQMDKICDYITEKYCVYDENGILKNWKRCCKACPFSTYEGEFDSYECNRLDLDEELSPEFEEVIKND